MDLGYVIMDAGILAAIILCIVGIIKLPFKTFKTNHPTAYKITFCAVSLVLIVGGSIICQLFIIGGALASVEYAVLLLTTIAGVFGLYGSYEGLGLKELAKKLVAQIDALLDRHQGSKLEKVIEKYGISTIIQKNAEMQAAKKQAEQQTTNSNNTTEPQ